MSRRGRGGALIGSSVAAIVLAAAFVCGASEGVEEDYRAAREKLFERTLSLARLARVAGDDARAQDLYHDAFLLHPYDREVREVLVSISEENGGWETQVEVYQTVLSRLGSAAQIRASLARALFLSGRSDQALGELGALVKEDPQDATRVLRAARVLVARGRFEDARRFLAAGLERFRTNPLLYAERARLFLMADAPGEAAGMAESALEHARSDALESESARLRAAALSGAGRFDDWFDARRADYERRRDQEITRLLQRADALGAGESAVELLRGALALAADASVREVIETRLSRFSSAR